MRTTGYDILFDLVVEKLHSINEHLCGCETYLVCFSKSYDKDEWDMEHALLTATDSSADEDDTNKWEWEYDFDEGQDYYKVHYIVKLSDVWDNLDREYTQYLLNEYWR